MVEPSGLHRSEQFRRTKRRGRNQAKHGKKPSENPGLTAIRGYFSDVLDDEVRASFEAALDSLRSAGAVVSQAEIPDAAEIAPIYVHIVLSEAAVYHAATLESMPDRYTAPVRQRLELGRYILAEDYVRALAGRDTLRRHVDAVLSACDALVLPTLPIPAPLLGAEHVHVGTSDQPVRNVMLRLTQLFNLTGHPAVSLPCGLTSERLPCGLQIAGARSRTEELLAMSAAVERCLMSNDR